MPIYEYQCRACGHQFEIIQKMSDSPLKDCPTCHKDTLSKLISSTSFQLKGTGWYATDFRDKGKAPKKETANEATNKKTDEKKIDEKKTEGSSSSNSSSTD